MTTKKTTRSLLFKQATSFVFIALFSTGFLFAQESTTEPNKPVSGTYNSGIFMENQTVLMYPAKTIEFVINHRFGKISEGVKELFGIYSPSNIRMGINYSITNKLQVGIGTTKFNKQQDLSIKYGILEQTTNGKIPVSITYFGSAFLDAREATNFDYENYKFAHRLSYFHEIMFSHKFCEYFNLQAAPTFAYFNVVERTNDTVADPLRRNYNFGLSVLGKLNITPTIALFCEYDHNFTRLIKKYTGPDPKPNISIGFENATSAHSFQLFITTAYDITYQRNMVYNQNDFLHSGLMLGFNITRVFY
ncbi:MAG: DUF5777 family beta-barrel protein [Bacteroidales bacterium]